MTNKVRSFQYNPELPTTKAPTGWLGTPVDADGRFLNINHPYEPHLRDLLKWKFQKSPFRDAKKAELWKPTIDRNISWLDETDNIVVWLGHSSFYIRINGIRILTDPVFFDILSVKRESELPIDPTRFINIDYVLLSHDHRDHLDEKSLKLIARQNPDAHYLTGLEMKKIVKEFTNSQKIQEAGWYQQYVIPSDFLKIAFVPSRHWSKRGISDTNKRLWGGFVIETAEINILFGGDSGYDSHYKDFKSVFGQIDYAIIGIGAYEPAWFMHPNHQSPADALRAFGDLQAKRFIPMHYSTFDLSDEPMSAPLKSLQAAAKKMDIEENLDILTIGSPLRLVFSKK